MRSVALILGTLCAIGTVSANWAELNEYCTYMMTTCQNKDPFHTAIAYQVCLCSAWIQQGRGRCREGCVADLMPVYKDRTKVVGMCGEYCNHHDKCDAWPKDCGTQA